MASPNNYTGHWMANAAGAAMRSPVYRLATEPMEPEPATTTMAAKVTGQLAEWTAMAGSAGVGVRSRSATVAVEFSTEAPVNVTAIDHNQLLAQLVNLTAGVTKVAHDLTVHLDVSDPLLWLKLVLTIISGLFMLNGIVRVMWYRRTGHIRKLPGKILIYPADV